MILRQLAGCWPHEICHDTRDGEEDVERQQHGTDPRGCWKSSGFEGGDSYIPGPTHHPSLWRLHSPLVARRASPDVTASNRRRDRRTLGQHAVCWLKLGSLRHNAGEGQDQSGPARFSPPLLQAPALFFLHSEVRLAFVQDLRQANSAKGSLRAAAPFPRPNEEAWHWPFQVFLGVVGWVHDRERSSVSATTAPKGTAVDNCWHGDIEGASDSSQRPRYRHLQRLWKASMFVCCQEAGQRGGRNSGASQRRCWLRLLWKHFRTRPPTGKQGQNAARHQLQHWRHQPLLRQQARPTARLLQVWQCQSPPCCGRGFIEVPVCTFCVPRMLCEGGACSHSRAEADAHLTARLDDWLGLDTEVCMIPAKEKRCSWTCWGVGSEA